MTDKTWSELLGLRPPTPKQYSKAVPLAARCPQLLYGIELEIEGINNPEEIKCHGLQMKEDGSLRNNGKEFVSLPMSYSNLMFALKNFFESNKFTDANYSERCSIHVHTNCANLTIKQIASVCLIYQVYEDLLFSWVGAGRSENIFCVPWNQTSLSYRLFESEDPALMHKKMRSWQKYTALNLLPLLTQNTIEWRHMPGLCNVNTISTWLQLIGSVFQFALDNKQDEIEASLVNLNTSSAYDNITHQIFGPQAHSLLSQPGAAVMLEEGVLNMKASIHGKNKGKNIEQATAAANQAQQRDLDVAVQVRAGDQALAGARFRIDPPARRHRDPVVWRDEWNQVLQREVAQARAQGLVAAAGLAVVQDDIQIRGGVE